MTKAKFNLFNNTFLAFPPATITDAKPVTKELSEMFMNSLNRRAGLPECTHAEFSALTEEECQARVKQLNDAIPNPEKEGLTFSVLGEIDSCKLLHKIAQKIAARHGHTGELINHYVELKAVDVMTITEAFSADEVTEEELEGNNEFQALLNRMRLVMILQDVGIAMSQGMQTYLYIDMARYRNDEEDIEATAETA